MNVLLVEDDRALRDALRRVLEVSGYRVTAGTTLAIGRRSVQRDPALWESPNTFDPDRFSPQQSAARDRWSYLPFGAGPRSCIGQHFAMQQATLALADITRRFEIDSLSNDFPTTVAFTVTPDGPVPAAAGQTPRAIQGGWGMAIPKNADPANERIR